MKVGILTFHNAHNYGAALQAYALRSKLREMGHDTHIIDYRNKNIEKKYREKLHVIVSKKQIYLPIYWPSIIKQVQNNKFAQSEWRKQYKNFRMFLNTILLENKEERLTKEKLSDLDYDAFICGSDQIWTSYITGGLDPVYFLDFNTNALKVAYAASINTKNIPIDEQPYFKEKVKQLDFVATREATVAEVLGKLCGRDIQSVLDPTLLLDAKDYEKLLSNKKEKEKYIFAYFIQEDAKLMKCAQYVAQKLGYKLIELHYYLQKDLEGHNQRADMGPSEFLTYMKHAEFILTNSFHGTIFSILYHKSFYSVYTKDERKDDLLKAVDLEKRHINEVSEIDLQDHIDYIQVDKLLSDYRKTSLEFLQDALSNNKEVRGAMR